MVLLEISDKGASRTPWMWRARHIHSLVPQSTWLETAVFLLSSFRSAEIQSLCVGRTIPFVSAGGTRDLLLGRLLGLSVVPVAAAVRAVPWLTDATSASLSCAFGVCHL